MFKNTMYAAAAAWLLAGGHAARADIIEFNFNLDGSQEVPANDSTSVGSAQILYDTDTQTFDLDVVVFGIELAELMGAGANGTPIHFHLAPAGMNGPIVVDVGFFGTFQDNGQGIRLMLNDVLLGGTQGNVMSDVNTNEAALFAGDLYLNVHTSGFPGGEIRGQVPMAVPAPGALALLGIAGMMTGSRRRRR